MPIFPEHEPDRLEKGIRFGCGFVVGVCLAASIGLTLSLRNVDMWWIVIVVAGLVCGLLAVRYGNAFWRNLRWW